MEKVKVLETSLEECKSIRGEIEGSLEELSA